MADFLTDSEFEKYRNLIYNQSGIHFSSSNRTILESRLKERIKLANCENVNQYFTLIQANEEEMKILLDSVTTNLTKFFRNIPQFETLEYFVIPDLVQQKRASGEKHIRIWSAGCSTGEEPYTIAMMLKEVLPQDFTFEVTASDLSLKSLLIGKEGFYQDTRIEGIPEKYLSKYFEKLRNGYQIKDEIKKNIKFDYHNLKYDSGQRKLDVIFCRNVLIYFDEAAQKAVIEKFWESLSNHSYLFIGHSESLFGMNTKFEFVKTNWACIYKKFV